MLLKAADITVLKVNDKKTSKAFNSLPGKLYSSDPEWIGPIDSEVQSVFDPHKNNFFQHGTTARWILLNHRQESIGRIAAFIDHHKINPSLPSGGIGFFECINDKSAAHQLFDTAGTWLRTQGITE